ncbi:MAG: tetratricopeptide repeat protein, partial [Acidobacteria bacterium]|nr:tetratricopeptide repeat protein [Acidobacteriota bacterium]
LALIAFAIYQRPKPSTAIRSIAVLPFRDLSENPPRDFLSVGLADSLITQLASSGSLVIRPTISVLKYATQPKDPIEAGREQGVDAVLDGKILSTGNRIRVSAQLIRLNDGLSLWTGEFEDSPDRIASIETNVVKSIAQSIQLKLGSLTEKVDSLSLTQNPKAYEAYLRGRWLWNRRTEESMRRSIDAFDQSIAADPNFALAWAGLADSWALMASFSAEPGARTHPNARAAANRAIQLDPKLAEPHASLGMISFFSDWDGPAAEREFLLAIGLQPNYATAHHWRGLNLAAMGRLPEALKELEEARRLDPLSLIIGTNVGWMLYQSRRYDDAIAEFRRTLELDANFPRAHTRLGITLLLKGEAASAEKELRKALELSGGDPYISGVLGYALARSGQRDAALKIASSLIDLSRSHYVPPFGLALLYLGLDDQKSALDWLQKALSDRSTTMVYAKVDPILDPLRSKPQFLKLLSQMKF